MTKVFVVAALLLFLSTESRSQHNHRIIYHKGHLGDGSDFIIKNPTINSRLIFNDTLSYYDLDGLKSGKSGTIGNKLIHHSEMYNLNKKALFEMVNFKGKYLIENDRVPNWTLLKESKYIIGYKCFAAISINEKGDTTKAWYAPEINKPFGPSGYKELPGIILEVQDQRYNGHIIAVKMEKTNHTLMFPTHPIISAAEFRKRRSRK